MLLHQLSPLPSDLMQISSYHFYCMASRVGYLYGTFGEKNSVKVDCIYEPPQDTTDTGFTLLDDPKADRVAALAGLLGLRKVGWIFAHPPREEK